MFKTLRVRVTGKYAGVGLCVMQISVWVQIQGGFPGSPVVKNAYQGRRHKRPGFGPCVGKTPWRRAWQPTPVFLPEKSPMDRGAWQATVHGVAESRTQLRD